MRTVVWGSDQACGFRTKTISVDENLSCEAVSTPRGVVSVVHHNGLNLSVIFGEEDGFLIAATSIKNNTETPFEFDSDLWGAAHFATKADFASGKKPIFAETAIPSRDIVRGITSGVNLDNSMDVFMAGMSKTAVVKEVRKPDGTRIPTTVIADDKDAATAASARSEVRGGLAAAEKDRIRKTAITQKWVKGNSSVNGLVYFRRVNKAEMVLFSFRVLDTNYLFRLLRDKNQNQ